MPTSELKFTQSIRDQKAVQSAQNKRKFTQLIQDQETVQSAQNKRESSLNRSQIRRLFNRPKIKETHSIDPRSESCSIGPNQETIHWSVLQGNFSQIKMNSSTAMNSNPALWDTLSHPTGRPTSTDLRTCTVLPSSRRQPQDFTEGLFKQNTALSFLPSEDSHRTLQKAYLNKTPKHQ